MTPEQTHALERLTANRGEPTYVMASPFGLPAGYVLVEFGGGQTVAGGFTCGVAPDGSVSS